MSASPFAVGQKWSISGKTCTIVVGRIETVPSFGVVVHVSVEGMSLLPGNATGANVGHMPFSEAALAASIDAVLSTGARPDAYFEEGYEAWREGNGGIWTTRL